MNRFRSVLASIIFVTGLGVAEAQAQVFAVESPSYVRQIVTAAHQIVQQQPNVTVGVRTTEQVLSEDEAMLHATVAASRVIVLGRVYGDVAQKLRRALTATDLSGKTIFAVYSDPDLMRFTRLHDQFVFEGVSDVTIRAIADSVAGDNPATAIAEWERREPRLRAWTQGLAYVAAKGPVNFHNLLSYLIALPPPGGT